MPDFLAALYAAVVAVSDGQVTEADVSYEVQYHDRDRTATLTVTVRRYDPEPESAEVAE
jgi:hypothetical protein